jgi:predicted nucleic acid-binding protein
LIPPGLFLVDTSAISRVSAPEVLHELTQLGRLGLLATCATVDLEVLYSARSPREYVAITNLRREGFTDLPLLPAIGTRAVAVQGAMAQRGQHRAAGVVDLLTAAIAEHYGATIIHYDSDFDHIALVTQQAMRWVVPRGSVD